MFTSAMQFKGWLKNKSKQTGAHANDLLQMYMMERLLERVSRSSYRENLIIKGGFLIASMVGIDRRSTMDMDTTVKGLPISREGVEKILNEIIAIDVGDGVSFEIKSIKNIHDVSEYDDFRVSLLAMLYTVQVDMKIDITTGDTVIPREIEYNYKLMFEERTIPVMAYNLYTILAEKIETILARSIGNTRGRDYYDAYLPSDSAPSMKAAASLSVLPSFLGDPDNSTIFSLIRSTSASSFSQVYHNKSEKKT